MDEATKIIEDEIAQEMQRLKISEGVIDAIMYLRSAVGTEFDTVFHQIARKSGELNKSLKDIE